MKQFLSILKDSFREARDGKLLYLMLALSVLLTLLTFSISFRPMSLEQSLKKMPSTLNTVYSIMPKQPGQPLPPTYKIDRYRQTNGAAEPWNGDYEWDFVLEFDSPAARDGAKKGSLFPFWKTEDVQNLYVFSKEYYFLKNVGIKEVGGEPNEIRYRITSHGTRIDNVRAWPHEIKILFGLLPFGIVGNSLEEAIYNIEKWVIHKVGSWLAILIGVVITSFFIPNMLRKGSIDLLIAKPIHRVTLLVYKYIGGLAFMAVVTVVAVVGIWVALGVRPGVWATGFLWVVPGLIYYFAMLYAVSTLAAVLTRNPMVCILATCLVWAAFWADGFAHSYIEGIRRDMEKLSPTPAASADGRGRNRPKLKLEDVPDWATTLSDVIHAVFPRTSDLDELNSKLISESVLSKAELERKELDNQRYPPWFEVIGISFAYIVVLLGLASWRFVKMDA